MPYPNPLAHPSGTSQDRPMFVITHHPDGQLRYRCWDTSASYIAGEPAAVDKMKWHFGSVLAALLADQARLHVPEMRAQSVLIQHYEYE